MVVHVGNTLENVKYGFRIREDVSENEMLKNISRYTETRKGKAHLRKVDKRKLLTEVNELFQEI